MRNLGQERHQELVRLRKLLKAFENAPDLLAASQAAEELASEARRAMGWADRQVWKCPDCSRSVDAQCVEGA